MARSQDSLIGRRFGKLLVVAYAGTTGGRYPKHLWRCECDCGRFEVVMQARLVGKARPIEACTHCRQPRCKVCGTRIALDYPSQTACSDVCRQTYTRQKHREDYYRRVERNPDFNKLARARLLARAEADPALARRLDDYSASQNAKRRERRQQDADYAAKLARQSRERYQRHRSHILARRRERWRFEPGYADYRRGDNRQHYQKHRDAILAGRRRRWQEMSPTEQRDAQDAQRKRVRMWSRRWRAELRKNPEARRRQLAREREWERDRQLRRLFANLEKLKRDDHE